MLKFLIKITVIATFLVAGQTEAAQELIAAKVDGAPVIDGLADEAIWSQAKPVVTRDSLANIDITIKAVHTKDSLYILATFPDSTENRNHKTMVWVPEQERYRTGADREDTFVIKWSMEPGDVDLSVGADSPYKADIWYWKAHRTDHAGYADDKSHLYSAVETPRSKPVISERGRRFYLSRPGDRGDAAYQTIVHAGYVGKTAGKYRKTAPTGSRADVRAKGMWRNGIWTVEFERKLVTDHLDDIQLKSNQRYQFGVSRFEIAGRRKNPKLEEPYFGAGEITESLHLKLQ